MIPHNADMAEGIDPGRSRRNPMSDEPFLLPPVPLMTPAKARDAARLYKAMADHLTELGLRQQANVATRDSQWWMTYSIALAQTKDES
jgi:hypothetical protein